MVRGKEKEPGSDSGDRGWGREGSPFHHPVMRPPKSLSVKLIMYICSKEFQYSQSHLESDSGK